MQTNLNISLLVACIAIPSCDYVNGEKPKENPDVIRETEDSIVYRKFPGEYRGVYERGGFPNVVSYHFCERGKFYSIVHNKPNQKRWRSEIEFKRFTAFKEPKEGYMGILAFTDHDEENDFHESFALDAYTSQRIGIWDDERGGKVYLKRTECPAK